MLPPTPPQPLTSPGLAPVDWSRYRRSWTDDSNDCISSSFEEALRLQHGDDAPDLPDMEAAYRLWHPGWDDSPDTMVLEWYWEALNSIGVYVEALHQLGDIVDQIVDRLDRGYFPTAWVYLWNGFTGQWFHHAIVAVDHYDNWLVFYDPQRGFGWEYDKTLFRQTGLDGATSGYAYAAFWEGPPTGVTMEPMKKSVMLWQYDHTREKTVAEWVTTLRLGAIDCFRVKSHDGLALMGRVYSHPLAPVSLDEIERQYEAFGAEGITYMPWCNPLGKDVPAEAALAVEVARRCGNRLDVDIEVGPEFWNVHNPAIGNRRIPEYFQRIADAGIEIIVDTAMFEGWVEALRLAEVAPYVRRLLSQSYWVGFGKPYRDVIAHDVAEMRRTGIGEIGIVADVRAKPAEFAAAAAYAQSLGCVEFSGWAADFATPASYDGYSCIPTAPFLDAPTPPINPDELWAAIVRIAGQVRATTDTLDYVARPGNTEVTEQVALDESYRIASLWQTKAMEVHDLVLRLKE